MEERTLPGLGRQFTSKKGKLTLFSAGPVLLAQFIDYGEGEFATPVLAAFDAIVGAGSKVELFFDMGRMVNYDSALRTRMTVHFAANRPHIASLHVFTRSRLVAMGVSVANLALGRLITMHGDMSQFVAALDEITRRHRTIGISGTLLSAS